MTRSGTAAFYYLRIDADSGERAVLDDRQVDVTVDVFRMLADPTRVRILWALTGRELAVNDLAAQVGKPAPSVSQHLAKLRLARLVATRRAGTSVIYRVANEHIAQLVTDAVHNAEHATSDAPRHHRADRSVPAPTEGGGAPTVRTAAPTSTLSTSTLLTSTASASTA